MPPRPSRFGELTLNGEITIMALKYTINLPAPGASDVAIRKVSKTIGSDPTTVTELGAGVLQFVFEVARDAAVALQLTDVDGSGNASQPGPVFAFTATDTVPPPTPGEMSVASVEQTD